MKPGDLVTYVPSASSTFKWEKYRDRHKSAPGVIIESVKVKGTTTRRFKIRWHDGEVSEEWITYLEPYGVT